MAMSPSFQLVNMHKKTFYIQNYVTEMELKCWKINTLWSQQIKDFQLYN